MCKHIKWMPPQHCYPQAVLMQVGMILCVLCHDVHAVPCFAMLCLQNYQVDATTTLLHTEDSCACYTPLCHDVHTVS